MKKSNGIRAFVLKNKIKVSLGRSVYRKHEEAKYKWSAWVLKDIHTSLFTSGEIVDSFHGDSLRELMGKVRMCIAKETNTKVREVHRRIQPSMGLNIPDSQDVHLGATF